MAISLETKMQYVEDKRAMKERKHGEVRLWFGNLFVRRKVVGDNESWT